MPISPAARFAGLAPPACGQYSGRKGQGSAMKYDCEIVIDRPRDEVVALFDNPDNLKHWMAGLQSFEPLSGKLVMLNGRRRMEMVETIVSRNLPDEITGTYEMPGVLNLQCNRFLAEPGGRTKWQAETEFRFDGWFLKTLSYLLPGIFKAETMKFMTAFKKFAEAPPPATSAP
jgi:uncharacterized membrane protein